MSTPVFKPMVGGMETMADNLSYHFCQKGHKVKVVTPIPFDGEDDELYEVVRQPSFLQKIKLIKESDIIYSNGASLYLAFFALVLRKKFVWTHTGYQVSCIDGLGWHNGGPAPMSPWKSFLFHWKNSSPAQALKGITKVMALRMVAHYYVSANIAISDWMKDRQPLPRQIRIHNPFPIDKFKKAFKKEESKNYDFIYLGRLVSEKGVNVLVRAFAKVYETLGPNVSLSIIGDGDERKDLEGLAKELRVDQAIFFKGRQTGQELLDEVAKGRIAIVPSAWEEPFGGVATELMSAGKNIIVSRRGALAELVLDAGLTFDNGNHNELADQMIKLYKDVQLQKEQKVKIIEKLKSFNEENLIDDYLNVFKQVIA